MIYDRNAYKREWNRRNPGSHRRAHFKNRYGITVEDYEALCDVQEGKCAICSRVKALVVDHCHTTNMIRGALCKNCNFTLGLMRDDPRLLERAAKYLRATN